MLEQSVDKEDEATLNHEVKPNKKEDSHKSYCIISHCDQYQKTVEWYPEVKVRCIKHELIYYFIIVAICPDKDGFDQFYNIADDMMICKSKSYE